MSNAAAWDRPPPHSLHSPSSRPSPPRRYLPPSQALRNYSPPGAQAYYESSAPADAWTAGRPRNADQPHSQQSNTNLAPPPPTATAQQQWIKCSSCSEMVELEELGDHVCQPGGTLRSLKVDVDGGERSARLRVTNPDRDYDNSEVLYHSCMGSDSGLTCSFLDRRKQRRTSLSCPLYASLSRLAIAEFGNQHLAPPFLRALSEDGRYERFQQRSGSSGRSSRFRDPAIASARARQPLSAVLQRREVTEISGPGPQCDHVDFEIRTSAESAGAKLPSSEKQPAAPEVAARRGVSAVFGFSSGSRRPGSGPLPPASPESKPFAAGARRVDLSRVRCLRR
jgi:hypothetical protein